MNKISNFAKALFSLAEDKQNVKQIYNEAQQFLELVHDHPEIIKLFSNSSLNKTEKFAIIDATFQNNFDSLFCDFLRALVDMNEFFNAKMIFKKYLALVESTEHAKFIKIISAYPLSATQINKIKSILEQKMDFHLIVKNIIDPSIIAGVKIESDSKSLDWTIKGKLKAIETSLYSQKIIR